MKAWKTAYVTAALVSTALAGSVWIAAVSAQRAGVSSQTIGSARIDYTELIKGPTDLTVYTPMLEPGGRLGWHVHPGYVFVAVKAGEATVWPPDGCRIRYAAGQGFVMAPGETMDVRNEATTALELLATALMPAGSPLASDATVPTVECTR